MAAADFSTTTVVAANLSRRFSGVTATLVSLLPLQAERLRIAAFGPGLTDSLPRVRLTDILIGGWRPPAGAPRRIWHARRNTDMLAGVVLKHLLRQPWALVFTSAGQRRHTAYTRFLIRRMDALIATSAAAAAFLERPANVIPHGVDVGRFRPADDRAAAWRAAGLGGAIGVGAFGRVRPQKGTDVVVEAMLRLAPEFPAARLALTGLVAPQHAAFKAGLEARAAAMGLADRIRFLGERPVDEMPEWHRRVTIYVAPMLSEGFGLTPLEAMASGAAVVATRTGAAPLLVDDGVTGFLVPPGDVEALTAALRRLIADPGLAEAMGRAGRAKAVARHDLIDEAEAINAVYRALLAPHARAGRAP